MTDPAIILEQAVYGSQGAGGYRFLARSPGFLDDWLPEAERLCTGFGERPPGVPCPACVFAQPFDRARVAVVQVADQGADDAGRPGALGFRLLVLSHADYHALGGDPFLVAERFPAPWYARGELPALGWPPDEPPPPRTVERVRAVLQRDDGPDLLGGSQVLLDGGRLVFVRPAPDTALVRDLWALLPVSTRRELWPASFAFGNALGFDALVVPRAEGEEFEGYLTDEQAGEYPPGRYELRLQTAAEAGDQDTLDELFARRSRSEMFRLGFWLLGAVTLMALASAWLNPRRPEAPPAPKPAPPAPPRLSLEPAHTYPTPDEKEQQRLLARLEELAAKLGVKPPDPARGRPEFAAAFGLAPGAGFPGGLPWAALYRCGHAPTAWRVTLLLEALDRHLRPADPRRDVEPLWTYGPLQPQLRALLWKHGVAEFADRRLNPVELVDRLGQKVAPEGPP